MNRHQWQGLSPSPWPVWLSGSQAVLLASGYPLGHLGDRPPNAPQADCVDTTAELEALPLHPSGAIIPFSSRSHANPPGHDRGSGER